ncbi:hypothetical protein A2U01_0080223, partial [Trifolium medium]|nr:hypothetical protein [Trifolium medium]
LRDSAGVNAKWCCWDDGEMIFLVFVWGWGWGGGICKIVSTPTLKSVFE